MNLVRKLDISFAFDDEFLALYWAEDFGVLADN